MTRQLALMTVTEVAAELRVSTATVRRWIAAGKLPATTLPTGTYRVARADVDAILGRAA